MGRHVCSEEYLVEFIRRNPGLTNYQLNERLGRGVNVGLRKLLAKGLVWREKGFDPSTLRSVYKYYCRGNGDSWNK